MRMRKITLLLVVFTFILIGFGTTSVSAWDSGCIGTGLYSTTTGQLCNSTQTNTYNNTYVAGCTGAGPYNVITGQYCYGTQNNYYSQYSQTGVGINSVFYRELTFGSKGSDVSVLQQILNSRGYSSGNVDGSYGPITAGAVARFQQSNSLAVTGRADFNTLQSVLNSNQTGMNYYGSSTYGSYSNYTDYSTTPIIFSQ